MEVGTLNAGLAAAESPPFAVAAIEDAGAVAVAATDDVRGLNVNLGDDVVAADVEPSTAAAPSSVAVSVPLVMPDNLGAAMLNAPLFSVDCNASFSFCFCSAAFCLMSLSSLR